MAAKGLQEPPLPLLPLLLGSHRYLPRTTAELRETSIPRRQDLVPTLRLQDLTPTPRLQDLQTLKL